jgi:hypothetical protein
MTLAQQSALEALAGRALTAAEVLQIDPLLAKRDDVGIAEVLSVGRKASVVRTIDERGVRAALPIVDAVAFLTLLRETAAASTMPTWLETMLVAMDVPAKQHLAYFDTLACAHGWLQKEAGLDLGAVTTRAMLDMIAASDPDRFGTSTAVLKAMGERDDPVHYTEVSNALNGIV